MSFIDFIEPWYFFISFFIGLFFVYISTPTPEVIIKYPTPDKADKTIFEDDAENCYKFTANEVSCPTNKSEINKIPVQRKIETFRGKK